MLRKTNVKEKESKNSKIKNMETTLQTTKWKENDAWEVLFCNAVEDLHLFSDHT